MIIRRQDQRLLEGAQWLLEKAQNLLEGAQRALERGPVVAGESTEFARGGLESTREGPSGC